MKKRNKKNALVSRKKVLKVFFENPNKPLNHKQIAAALGVKTPQDRQQIINTLNQLQANGEIKQESPGKFKLNQKINTEIGVIDITRSGTAYLILDDSPEDIYIHKNNTQNALDGDVVKAQVYMRKGKKEASVVDIVERVNTQFVGEFELATSGKYGFVVANRKMIHVDIYVDKSGFNGAEEGDKVVVDIVEWNHNEDSPRGVIKEVLGKAGEHDVEIHSIMADYGLPYYFEEEVEREAQQIDTEIREEEIKQRRDFRKITTLTIDPKDAKDFDDALSFHRLENGNIEIGIHIADVSHYVQPGTILDNEAYRRATSVYLVDRVVPMLPEVLSNLACSLRPNEEKYTFSAVFELDNDAHLKSQWFGRTVINSDRRFTYEEAQEIIEGKEGDFASEIREMNRLAKIMRKRRMDNGAIAFDKLEVKFELDENKNPIGVYFKEGKEANHLIEEFMLLANQKVSEFVTNSSKLKTPKPRTYIYRVHDSPDPVKLASLKDFVKTLGYSINVETPKRTSESLNTLLKEVKGKGEANMIETLAMRSMSKAEYSTDNIGHYGLAFEYYTHFTSPIRRYPDVIAHRLLQEYLDGRKSPNKEIYAEQCEHSSERERTAADAERDSTKYMQVKYMEKFIGHVFDGVITGVTEWGIYVEANKSKAEGLIRLKDLTDDHYVYDAKHHSIKGQKNKEVYQLGDAVTIKLIKADLDNKTLDYQLV